MTSTAQDQVSQVSDATISSETLALEAGVTYRQLDYWCRTGLVRPRGWSSGPGHGSGHRRLFTGDDVLRVRALGALSRLLRSGSARNVGFTALPLAGEPPWVIEEPGLRITIEVRT